MPTVVRPEQVTKALEAKTFVTRFFAFYGLNRIVRFSPAARKNIFKKMTNVTTILQMLMLY